MQKLRLLLLLFTPFLLAMSCDEDPSDETPRGTWRLVNVTGGISGVSHDFPDEAITWEFNHDSNGQTLTVANNNTNPDLVDFFDTGVYDYEYVDNSIPETCEHITKVEDTNLGCQRISNTGVLTFTQLAADGYVITLHKN